jgi:hypothetical protein
MRLHDHYMQNKMLIPLVTESISYEALMQMFLRLECKLDNIQQSFQEEHLTLATKVQKREDDINRNLDEQDHNFQDLPVSQDCIHQKVNATPSYLRVWGRMAA